MKRGEWRSGSVLAYVRPDDVHVPTFVAQTLEMSDAEADETDNGLASERGCEEKRENTKSCSKTVFKNGHRRPGASTARVAPC